MFEFELEIGTLLCVIPLLPLLSAIGTALFGKRWLKERAHLPTVIAFAASFCASATLLTLVQAKIEHADAREAQAAANRAVLEGSEAQEIAFEIRPFEEIDNLWTWVGVTRAYRAHPTDFDENEPHPGLIRDFQVDVSLRADSLTCVMLVMVTFVSMLVAIYAAGYVRGDPGYARFFTYVSLFVFSMTMLVSVSNFALLYVFWEAVGVCSYLLIGFWYRKPEAAAAGKKAFLVNRVGDFGFALAVFLIWTTYGTLDFHDSLNTVGVLGAKRLANPALYVGGGVGLAICLLLLTGACGKSAQFPLHVWLPDAMEGPTPVSALIHAATMVTAGVYMIARCTPLFSVSAEARLAVALVGGITALMAALIALTQTDLKRVLAYSTVSQLGFMFLGLGTGSQAGVIAAMFHLFTHAFFKALLFLGAGSVMHAMGNVIDMRRFGGLRRVMPRTCLTFWLGALALAGIVPFAGFWSKDAIVAALHERGAATAGPYHEAYGWLYLLALLTAFLTAFYTFRALFLTFYGPERIPEEAGDHAHESPAAMVFPLVILGLAAVVVGAYLQATGSFVWLLEHLPMLVYGPVPKPHGHEFHLEVAAISTILALSGAGLAAYLYLGDRREVAAIAKFAQSAAGLRLYQLSSGKFFFDPLYQAIIVWPLRFLSRVASGADRWGVDGLVDGLGKIPAGLGSAFRSLQSGMTQFYALAMAFGVALLLGVLLLW